MLVIIERDRIFWKEWLIYNKRVIYLLYNIMFILIFRVYLKNFLIINKDKWMNYGIGILFLMF